MNTSIVVFSLFFASTVAFAQDAYKCKVNGAMVIQDSPCKVAGPSGPAPNTPEELAAIETGKALCKEIAPKAVSWKDPESLRIGEVIPGKVASTEVNGKRIRGRHFSVPVNAKNSYGGYTGEKILVCITSEDGQSVLKVSTILMDMKN